ncbi:hypothetical protein GJV85_13335 (plasmid) [Sulfurimonas aquatica]|uniref:Uncharacterized protein n=1 Tax=Sulfurimonas aquatica TaxID=2672570 RepID=A0A975B2V9_9BACT|nr:hypothetical protein [Sulfurimonas aquatica]QSZ43153.1 hypothetical protein GJV85_13335 [Sulfurimonas aquatica]
MWLTGIILLAGSAILFGLWAKKFYGMKKYSHLVKKQEMEMEQIKGIVLFIAIAISAGMVWG